MGCSFTTLLTNESRLRQRDVYSATWCKLSEQTQWIVYSLVQPVENIHRKLPSVNPWLPDMLMNPELCELRKLHKRTRKEPIKPKPGPDLPLQASVEDITMAGCSRLPWASSDLKISWSFAAVILTTAVHSLGFPLLRNRVTGDKRLFVNGTRQEVNSVIAGHAANVCFWQTLEVDMSLLHVCSEKSLSW